MENHSAGDSLARVPLPRPTLDGLKALVLDSLSSPHSRRAYGQALDSFFRWALVSAPDGFTKASVQRYRLALEHEGLAPSSINVQLSAIRKLANEAADNGRLAPELAAAIGRVKGAKRHGTRTGNWLTQGQAESNARAARSGEQ